MSIVLPTGWSWADYSSWVDPILVDCTAERTEWIYARTPQNLLVNVGQWLATGSTSAPLPTGWAMAEFTEWVTRLIAEADAAYDSDVLSKIPYELIAITDSYIDAETPAKQWADAVISNGGTVGPARKSVIQSFIAAEMAAGTWALTDDYWALWAENAIQALTSVKQKRLAVAVNAPVFLANRHYEFDGATSYISTGFVASTHAVAMTTDSARIAVYERTNVAFNGYAAGVHASTSRSLRINPRTTTPLALGAAMHAVANYTLPNADSRGLTAASRSAGSASAAWRNGVALVQTAPPASFGAGVPDLPIFIGAYNLVTTGVSSFRPSAIGFVSVGAALTAQQEKDQFDNIQNWAKAVGAAAVGQDEPTLWANAVIGRGGSVSSQRRALVTNLVNALKAAGTWDLIDDAWMLVAENPVQSLVSLKQRRLATAVNAPAFTVDRGYVFNGTSNYIDTGFVPSTHAVAMTGSSMSIAVYERTNVGASTYAMGVGDAGTQNLRLFPRTGSDVYNTALNSTNANSFAVADSRGLTAANRADTTFSIAKNGANLGTFVPTPTGTVLPIRAIYIGAQNQVGAANSFRAATIGFACVGASIPAAQQLAFYQAIQSFMIATGADVMSTMIILTAEQASTVRGPSSSVPHAALEPIELEDGRFVLPIEVLDDPAHAEHHDMLDTLPSAKVDTLVFKAPAEDPPPNIAA